MLDRAESAIVFQVETMPLQLPWRLLITVVTIAPLGFLMGMPLPFGMRFMEQRSPRALAWAWGVNGSLSVMGTVFAMVASIFFGITFSLMFAAASYTLALAAYGGAPKVVTEQ